MALQSLRSEPVEQQHQRLLGVSFALALCPCTLSLWRDQAAWHVNKHEQVKQPAQSQSTGLTSPSRFPREFCTNKGFLSAARWPQHLKTQLLTCDTAQLGANGQLQRLSPPPAPGDTGQQRQIPGASSSKSCSPSPLAALFLVPLHPLFSSAICHRGQGTEEKQSTTPGVSCLSWKTTVNAAQTCL